MKIFQNCEKSTKNIKISLRKKQSEIVFENPEKLEFCVIKVDGFAITEGIRTHDRPQLILIPLAFDNNVDHSLERSHGVGNLWDVVQHRFAGPE
jgi:hypothetical protein